MPDFTAIIDEGSLDFDPKDSPNLKQLYKKYSEVYIPFLQILVDKTGGKDLKINNIFSLLKETVKNLGKLTAGVLAGDLWQKLLIKVFDDIDKIKKGFEYIKLKTGKGEEIEQALDDTETETDTSFESMQEEHGKISEKAKKVTAEKAVKKPLFTKTTATLKGVGGALAFGMLGPYASLAAAGLMAGKEVVGATGRGVGTLKRKLFGAKPEEEEAIPSVGMPEAIPEAISKAIPEVAPKGVEKRVSGKLTGAELVRASSPLFYFFDKQAHKAHWTAQVLALLKKGGAGGAGAEGIGGLLKMLGAGAIGAAVTTAISTALLASGAVASVAAAVGAGILAKKVTDELREKDKKLAAGLDIFKQFLPGAGLINPLKGPKYTADAYEMLTKAIVSAIKKGFADIFAPKKEAIASSLKAVMSPTALIKGAAEGGFRSLMGFPKTPTANVEEIAAGKVSPMMSAEIMKEKVRETALETKIVARKEGQDKTISLLLEKLITGITILSSKVDNQTGELKPKANTFTPQDTKDVSYGDKDKLMDGVNIGSLRI